MKDSSLPWFVEPKFDFESLYSYYFNWALDIAFELLIFDNMPETINPTFFKYCIYCLGKVVVFKDETGDLLALNGAMSNEPDVYYIPENVILSNPRLIKSYNLRRDKECVVIYCTESDKYNFRYYGGLHRLLTKTATMLADNDLSINVAQKNTRLLNIISADDQNTKNSVDVVFKKMYDGDPYVVVQTNLVSDLKSIPITNTGNPQYIVQLVELHQYILSHFYEALGIQTHDNMKKERLITAEVEEDPTLVRMNIENIFKTVSEGISKVNAMFGTEIVCRLNPLLEKQSKEKEGSEEVSDSTEYSSEFSDENAGQSVEENDELENSNEPVEESQEEPESVMVTEVVIDAKDDSTVEVTINNDDRGDTDEDTISDVGETKGDISR